jgi:hypothetical protein
LFVAFQPKQPCDFIVTERVHFFGDDIANGPLFLTTRFRFASFPTPNCALCLEAKFSDKFGHGNCVILRDWCKCSDLHFPL